MKTLTITQIDAKDYLSALHAAHALMTRQLRMIENDQMFGNKPSNRTRSLIDQLEALEKLGAEIEEIANG